MSKRSISTKMIAMLLCTLSLGALVGCGAEVPTRLPSSVGSSTGTEDTEPDVPDSNPAPTQISEDPNDVPTNTPQAIPQVGTNSEPGEVTLNVQAKSATITPIDSVRPVRVISISSTLTWGRVANTTNYRILRAVDLKDGEEGTVSKYKVIATVSNKIGFFVDGGKVLGNLEPERSYSYIVQALDSMGRVIAKSNGNQTVKPLFPIMPAYQKDPEANAITTNTKFTFGWDDSTINGSYVEVFSAQFLVPMWVGYKAANSGELAEISYGQQNGLLPGTIPVVWSKMLSLNCKYAWSVTAVKYDGDSYSRSKAIAVANSPLRFFTYGEKTTTPE